MGDNMKIKNIFNESMNNKNFDESEIIKNNPEIFNKIDNDLQQIYNKYSFLLSGIDILLMDFDKSNICENLIDLFNDNIDKLSNELIECVKKYKNVELKQ